MAEDDDIGILELEGNLSDAEKPAELPVGWYTAEVQDVQKATSGKGNPYYAIRLHVAEDDIAADVRADFPDGATLSWNRQVVPTKADRRAIYSLRKLMEAMGLDTNVAVIDPNEWMGREVRIKVRHKPYEGEMRAEIQAIEAAEAQARTNGKRGAVVEEEGDEGDTPPARGGRGTAKVAPARGSAAKPGRGRAR